MNKLKTSTKVLIALAAAAIVLAVVLFLNMPETWSETIKDHHTLIMEGNFHSSDMNKEGAFNSFHRNGGPAGNHKAHGPFGGILIIGLIIFLVFKGKRYHGRKSKGRAIIDELYAEEKITEEEYRRRRTVIEEEGK